MPNQIALGFDTDIYPGDLAMEKWIKGNPAPTGTVASETLFQFTGYYLKSPCHHDTSWLGRWKTLTDLGWGLAVVYVGQQAAEAKCCSQNTLTVDQGKVDATDAAQAAAKEGLPAETIIFLDIERVDVLSPDLISYASSWFLALIEQGQYKPGLYCHVHNATPLWTALKEAYSSRKLSEAPRLWVVGGHIRYPFQCTPSASAMNVDGVACVDYDLPGPGESGMPDASLWQVQCDTHQVCGGVRLSIDVNVAALADPSNVLVASGKSAPVIPQIVTDYRSADDRMSC
jgi:hypothetical protein